MNKILFYIKKLIPKSIFESFQPAYHYLMAWFGNLKYGFPSRKIKVVGITGTKGKTTTAELVSAILEEAGHKTAIISTLRFKIGKETRPNLLKMTMPGRMFIPKMLREAVNAGCDYAVVEMTSEGSKQFRHRFIEMDALIFTNISPEHIESHGSYEKYLLAKLNIAKALENSKKKNKTLIVNAEDKEADKFLMIKGVKKIRYTLADAKPFTLNKDWSHLKIDGESVITKLVGEFNVYNILAAITFAKNEGISFSDIKSALEKFDGVAGRMEKVEIDLEKLKDENGNSLGLLGKFPPFTTIIDYAHTVDSLEKVYKVFKDHKKICVLGSAGGGRDKWKRPLMGGTAKMYCDKIILTNEDPYDENPRAIVEEVAKGITDKEYKIIMDRREAIREAFEMAERDNVVLITGKGTDPFIMGANGDNQEWSDRKVAEEELTKIALKKFRK